VLTRHPIITGASHGSHNARVSSGRMNPRILVVDDDIEFTQLLEFNLKRHGFGVSVASNGVQALRMARSELPDVILLDVMLPDLDGLSVCEILSGQALTREIPIFVISALQESWGQTRKIRAHYTSYFTKPVDLKDLTEKVRVAWEKKRALSNS
jgi:DNA-binding response OmpR family regulator